jgi:hypothetical protein
LKKYFAKKEDKLLDEIIESEHMISNKMALGKTTPCNLKKPQQKQNVLYNGNVIYTKHDPPVVTIRIFGLLFTITIHFHYSSQKFLFYILVS